MWLLRNTLSQKVTEIGLNRRERNTDVARQIKPLAAC